MIYTTAPGVEVKGTAVKSRVLCELPQGPDLGEATFTGTSDAYPTPLSIFGQQDIGADREPRSRFEVPPCRAFDRPLRGSIPLLHFLGVPATITGLIYRERDQDGEDRC